MKTIEQAAKELANVSMLDFIAGAEFADKRTVKLLTLFENDLFQKFYSSVDYSSRIKFIKDWQTKNLK